MTGPPPPRFDGDTTFARFPPAGLVWRQAQLVMSDETSAIYTVFGDGTRRVTLSQAGHTPSWTADGRIIYVPPSSDQIKIMDADGGHPATIIGGLSGVVKPQMVGDLISFALVPPIEEIWLVKRDGTGLRKLANGAAPFLSPDGTWLSFTLQTTDPARVAGFRREIWRVQIDGTGMVRLTDPDVDRNHPDGNASAISPDGLVVAVFWGQEDYSQPVFAWGRRDTALMPATGGTPYVLVACTPVTTMQEIAAYPPLPALLAADNPTFTRDFLGRVWVVYDGGRPDPQGGTFAIGADGADNCRVAPNFRGAGNVPVRWLP
jgi:WD40 repeat protein